MKLEQFIKDVAFNLPTGYSLHVSFLFGELDVQLQAEDRDIEFESTEDDTDASLLMRALNVACADAGKPDFYPIEMINQQRTAESIAS